MFCSTWYRRVHHGSASRAELLTCLGYGNGRQWKAGRVDSKLVFG